MKFLRSFGMRLTSIFNHFAHSTRARNSIAKSFLFVSIICGVLAPVITHAAYAIFEKEKEYILGEFTVRKAVFQQTYTAAQKTIYTREINILSTILFDKRVEFVRDYPTPNTAQLEEYQRVSLSEFSTHLRRLLSDGDLPEDEKKVVRDVEAMTQAVAGVIANSNLDQSIMTALGAGTTVDTAQELENISQANLTQTQAEGAKEPTKCGNIITDPFSDCIDAFISWIIKNTLLNIAGWFLWITATVMNLAIKVGILNFSQWAPDTLYPIWLVIRQIVSLFIVFAGLWLGFMYIINKGDQFKKYIPTLVLFALFVNFSYPITRSIIDVSNVVSLNIYASAVGVDALTAPIIAVGSDKTAGGIIRDRLGFGAIISYTLDGKRTSQPSAFDKINSVGPALLAVVFILYAAWIFFMVSALIITRTAVLVFLIVASPLLFVDEIIPKLGEAAKKLRGIFVEMLFVGPVFTIMLALTLKFLEVFQNGPLKTGVNATGNGADAISMFFNTLMMLIMLHIMLKVTKATSGEIGRVVSGATSMVGGLAVGGAFGGMAMAGRKVIGGAGRAALRAGTNTEGTGWMQKQGKGSFFSRAAFTTAKAVGNANYDGRNSSAVKWGAAKMGIGGMGTGGKLGYEALVEKKAGERSAIDSDRRNYAQRAIRTREARVKKEIEAINDPNERRTHLTNNLQGKDNEDLLRKLLKEEDNKALSAYKAFSDDAEGKKDKDAFFLKNSGNEELARRMQEFDTKTETDKQDKKDQRQEGRDMSKSLTEFVNALKEQKQADEGTAAKETVVNIRNSSINDKNAVKITEAVNNLARNSAANGGTSQPRKENIFTPNSLTPVTPTTYKEGVETSKDEGVPIKQSEASKANQEKLIAKAPNYGENSNRNVPGGGDPTRFADVESLRSGASHAAETNNVAPVGGRRTASNDDVFDQRNNESPRPATETRDEVLDAVKAGLNQREKVSNGSLTSTQSTSTNNVTPHAMDEIPF